MRGRFLVKKKMSFWTRKRLLKIEGLSRSELEKVLETAIWLKGLKGDGCWNAGYGFEGLRGKKVVNLFDEFSTRTRISFEVAAKNLGMDVYSMASEFSSLRKNESLLDTVRNLKAMGMDLVVIRHGVSGVLEELDRNLRYADLEVGIINAGDGVNEHPTQCLVDLLTIQESKKRIEGLKVAIVGDILHSRVSRSNMMGLRRFGVEVRLIGPLSLMPEGCEELGYKCYEDIEEGLTGVDIVYCLRLQFERGVMDDLSSVEEYVKLYRIDEVRLGYAREDVKVMHAGPVNWGLECDETVLNGGYSLIERQSGERGINSDGIILFIF